MKQASLEELENIRRSAERGRDSTYEKGISENNLTSYSRIVDQFQHILDLVENIKANEQD